MYAAATSAGFGAQEGHGPADVEATLQVAVLAHRKIRCGIRGWRGGANPQRTQQKLLLRVRCVLRVSAFIKNNAQKRLRFFPSTSTGVAVQLPMNARFFLPLLCAAIFAGGNGSAAEGRKSPFDATYRLIYHAVLEGAFTDGLGNDDVERILLRGAGGQGFQHFIYACPLCMPTINALQTYRQRAPIYGYKIAGNEAAENTYGPGLSGEQRGQLRSPEIAPRLTVINQLVQRWVEHRLTAQRLTPDERKAVQAQLEAGRKQGMEMLKKFKGEGSMSFGAPGYEKLEECAVCNGAVGLGYKVKP